MEAIARQPEASGDIRMNMIIAAALIEGVALLAVVVCLLVSFYNVQSTIYDLQFVRAASPRSQIVNRKLSNSKYPCSFISFSAGLSKSS